MRNQMMKRFILSIVAVAALVVATSGSATAQVMLDAPTRAFFGTIDDIPQTEVPGRASAYYDPTTGEITLVIGAEAILLGLNGEEIINSALIPLTDELGQITPAQNNESGIGYLNTNGILRGFVGGMLVNGVAGVAPFNLGPLLPAGLLTPEAFDAQFSQTADAATVFFAAGFSESSGFDAIAEGFQIITPVPEPGSLSLLALSALGFAARRRRR